MADLGNVDVGGLNDTGKGVDPESGLWHTLDDEGDRTEAALRKARQIQDADEGRRSKMLTNISIYEGLELGSFFPSAYFSATTLLFGDNDDRLTVNQARAVVNTAIAKIAGKQRPKAQFATDGADWAVHRRAKKLGRYCEAVMMQRQMGLSDAYALGLLVLRDALVCDSGWLKFWADKVYRRVCLQRIPPWEVMYDLSETQHGEPQNQWHVYGVNKFALAAQFPKRKEEILGAKSVEGDPAAQLFFGGPEQNLSQIIKVVEVVRLPYGPDDPGRRGIFLDCGLPCDLTVTPKSRKGEEWTRSSFPIEGIVWEPQFVGVLGTSMVDNVAGLNEQRNLSIQRRAEAERIMSNAHIVYTEGSVNEEQLEDNRIGIRVAVKQGFEKPEIVVPNSTSQGSIDWQQFLKAEIYDISGVSEQAATATKEPGVTAAIAMRQVSELGTERFATQWRAYEALMSIGAARQIVACTQELADDEGDDVIVKWPGGEYFADMPWSKVSLDEDQYHVQTYAVSGNVNRPEDRLNLANELADRGWIDREVYLQIVDSKDIMGALDAATKASDWIDKQIEMWLDASPDDEDDGKFRFRPPLQYLGVTVLTAQLVRVGLAWLDADMHDAPPFNLEFFSRWMKLANDAILHIQQVQATLQATAAGKGPVAPPPPPGTASPAPVNGAPAAAPTPAPAPAPVAA